MVSAQGDEEEDDGEEVVEEEEDEESDEDGVLQPDAVSLIKLFDVHLFKRVLKRENGEGRTTSFIIISEVVWLILTRHRELLEFRSASSHTMFSSVLAMWYNSKTSTSVLLLLMMFEACCT